MPSPSLSNKRIAYTAAAVSFTQQSNLLMLCTNQIRKDLCSNNWQETAIALHALAQILTPELARDLGAELIKMTSHSRALIRKRVLIVLFCCLVRDPNSATEAWPRVKDKLSDENQGYFFYL